MKKMMRSRPILACLMAAMLLSGCSQKKPVVVVPQQAPPAVPEPQPTPAEQQAQQGQPATQGTPPPEPPAQQETQPASQEADTNKTKSAKPRPTPKKTSTETARNTTPKTVVKPDGAEAAAAAGQISPSLSHDEILHSQATTEQLLQSTEASLNGIKRQLSSDEQAVVTQIHDYVAQSRQATKANDLTRAYNLALKARLLSDDLAKQR
jgi:outer membrane biosynthesis protein TonB